MLGRHGLCGSYAQAGALLCGALRLLLVQIHSLLVLPPNAASALHQHGHG
jgi:hypothetical protein